jgi:hypothetical protein
MHGFKSNRKALRNNGPHWNLIPHEEVIFRDQFLWDYVGRLWCWRYVAIFARHARVTLRAIKMQVRTSLVHVWAEDQAHLSTVTVANGAEGSILCAVRATPPTNRMMLHMGSESL